MLPATKMALTDDQPPKEEYNSVFDTKLRGYINVFHYRLSMYLPQPRHLNRVRPPRQLGLGCFITRITLVYGCLWQVYLQFMALQSNSYSNWRGLPLEPPRHHPPCLVAVAWLRRGVVIVVRGDAAFGSAVTRLRKNSIVQQMRSREDLNRKPSIFPLDMFLFPVNIPLSCKYSLKPIHSMVNFFRNVKICANKRANDFMSKKETVA